MSTWGPWEVWGGFAFGAHSRPRNRSSGCRRLRSGRRDVRGTWGAHPGGRQGGLSRRRWAWRAQARCAASRRRRRPPWLRGTAAASRAPRGPCGEAEGSVWRPRLPRAWRRPRRRRRPAWHVLSCTSEGAPGGQAKERGLRRSGKPSVSPPVSDSRGHARQADTADPQRLKGPGPEGGA